MSQECAINGNSFQFVLSDKDLIEINRQGKHFYKAWEEHLHADFSKLNYSPAHISATEEKSALKKVQTLGYDLDKLVILMPRAHSIQWENPKFWSDIKKHLIKQGFSVLENSSVFSVPEIYSLAKRAKALVALRSGLNDVLCELPIPQYIIYAHNLYYGDLQPMYFLQGFPWVAKEYINEYNALHQNIDEIKQDILNKLCKGK